MAEEELLQQELIRAQNGDGGWSYQYGSSWTEPTALAILALQAWGIEEPACSRARHWLLSNQRQDGGWSPQPHINTSTWVTTLAAVATSRDSSSGLNHERAINWILGQTHPPPTPVERLIGRLRGATLPDRPAGGYSWFPGTAAWVGPTAMSILALSDAASGRNEPRLLSQVRIGQQYLLSRRCRDGGWNHGGGRYRSENANSYPEMTGLALLALGGADAANLLVPLQRAEAFIQSPQSSEALSWLQLGLFVHGLDFRDLKTDLPCRTVRDLSLRLLALSGQFAGIRPLGSCNSARRVCLQ